MDLEQHLVVNEPSVVSETIDGEVVIINLDRGTYYSLRGSAAGIWGRIERGGTVGEIANDLAARYALDGTGAETEAHSFVAGLLEEELVRAAAPPPGAVAIATEQAPAATGERLPFEKPAIEKYTDMEALLLLDPIHEVDESGWPNVR